MRFCGLSQLLLSCCFLLSCTACAHKVPHVPPEQLHAFIKQYMGINPSPSIVYVDTKKQTLSLIENDKVKKTFVIATGKKGLGQQAKSFKTPLGLHRINEKIGEGVPKYGIFQKRQFVGDVWKKSPYTSHLKDYISTRILRLEGLQPGFNKGRDWMGRVVDTEQRAVYIHGTTMESKLGFPSTKGCVHMSAEDVIKFYNEVPVGTLVWIR